MKRNYHPPFSRVLTAAIFVSAWALLPSASATDFTSNGGGDWAISGNWTPGGNPNTGEFNVGAGTDNVVIDGHAIQVNQGTWGGNAGSNFTIRGGHSVTINNGGSLESLAGNGSVVIGNGGDDGSLIINDGTFLNSSANWHTYLGYNGGHGALTVGDGAGVVGSSLVDNTDGELRVGAVGSGSTGTLTVNGDGRVQNTALHVGNVSGSVGTAIFNGSGELATVGGAVLNTVGNSGSGAVTLNDTAEFTWNGTGSGAADRAFRIGAASTGVGTVTLKDESSFIGTGTQGSSFEGVAVGYSGQGVLNVEDNAVFDIGSSITVGTLSGSSGTVVQSGGAVEAQNVFMGRSGASTGSYTITDGTLTVSNRIGPGLDGTGTFVQEGGVVKTPRVNFGEAGNGAGTYELNGGTLRTNIIDIENGVGAGPDGVLDWGGGTLTMYEVNAGNSGGLDYTLSPSVGGVGQVVRAGTVLNVYNGDLTTGGTVGNESVLDLGGLYSNSGSRIDVLRIAGNLNLAGEDILASIGSANFLRPFGGAAEDYGTIPLIDVTGSLTGTFSSIIPPTSDSRRFVESTFAVSDPANLLRNTYYYEYTSDKLLFHFNVGGTVPEPSTGVFLVLGVCVVRFMRWALGKNALRRVYAD